MFMGACHFQIKDDPQKTKRRAGVTCAVRLRRILLASSKSSLI